ncbi:MAG: RDD family protein [Thiotrichales bacterium]|nr:RDD family protein [Thiotrichales bacterium]
MTGAHRSAHAAEAAARPGLLRRFAALVYDALLLFAVLFAATVPAVFVTGGEAVGPNHPAFTAYLFTVSYLYFGWCWTRSGQTLGMRAWRMRVRTREGEPLGWGRSLVRFTAAMVSIGAAGIGLLWVAFDRERLSLHDRLSATALETVSPRF